MNKLAPGWITAPIGAFATDCEQRIPAETETFKYIDIGSVNRITKRIEAPQSLLGKNAPSRARKLVRAGDVLVSMTRPNLNAVALMPAGSGRPVAPVTSFGKPQSPNKSSKPVPPFEKGGLGGINPNPALKNGDES